MKNWIGISASIIITIVGSVSFGSAPKCQMKQLRQTEHKLKMLEFSLKEAEVDFKRADPSYRTQVNDSVSRSLEKFKKSQIGDSKLIEKSQAVQAALNDFNNRPEEEELESTLTEAYFDFVSHLVKNPQFEIDEANATLKLKKTLEKEQSLWETKFRAKNKLFSQYVKDLADLHSLQSSCRVGRYSKE